MKTPDHNNLDHDLPKFIEKTLNTVDPGTEFLPNWHIELIAEYLAAAGRGEIKRLIINMPPRALKSVCVSVAWPAWLLGHDPRSKIIAASYASSLAIKHSIDTRQVLASGWYKRIFPETKLTRDQNEKRKFMTIQRGFRFATSVGGSVTGEGGNFLIIDDPMSPAQAMSRLTRENAHHWFDHTFASRLNDKRKGVIVLVMQRLHVDDMTGYLLNKGGWEHLCLPAVAVQEQAFSFGRVQKTRLIGELLHEARENHELIERAKIDLGASAFAAQYQQQPIAQEAGMIKLRWFGRYIPSPYSSPFRGEAGKGALLSPSERECPHPNPPPTGEGIKGKRIIQSWDTAIKSSAHHDASVCLTFAQREGRSDLLDARVMRLEYPDLKRAFYSLAEQWNPTAILLEDKASGQQLLQDARRETQLPLIAVNPKGDKLTRVAAISAMIEAGRVALPDAAPWLADFEAEVAAFPNAPHDDQVDALAQYLDWLRGKTLDNLRLRRV